MVTIETNLFFLAGVLRFSAVGGQQSDLLHDTRTELPVQLVTTGALNSGISGFSFQSLFLKSVLTPVDLH